MVCLGRCTEKPSCFMIRRSCQTLKEMPVTFSKCSPSREADQTLNPYPRSRGEVRRTFRRTCRHFASARESRPGGLSRRSPAMPSSRYQRRMFWTVASLQPRSSAISRLEAPAALFRMMSAFRNSRASLVENRKRSTASHSSLVSFHAAMMPSQSTVSSAGRLPNAAYLMN